ncbi:MAG: GNAT family N-acetyltransferase [Chloroflexota bacterium]
MGIKLRSYADAQSFLADAQAALELNEVAKCLMLGVCLRLVRRPERISALPCLRTVEDEGGLVPASMMTPPHKLVVYGHQGHLGEAPPLPVEGLVDERWEVPGVLGPREVARKVVETWRQISGQRYELERRQRLYELREAKSPVPGRGRLRLAAAPDVEFVAGWHYAFHVEVFEEGDRRKARPAAELGIESEDVYLWEDEAPLSMAMTTRPTRDGISVGLVYTPPELWGRGYATACVGEPSRLLLESGWGYCALFADVSNAPAIHVYHRIGYEPVCDYDEYASAKQD